MNDFYLAINSRRMGYRTWVDNDASPICSCYTGAIL